MLAIRLISTKMASNFTNTFQFPQPASNLKDKNVIQNISETPVIYVFVSSRSKRFLVDWHVCQGFWISTLLLWRRPVCVKSTTMKYNQLFCWRAAAAQGTYGAVIMKACGRGVGEDAAAAEATASRHFKHTILLHTLLLSLLYMMCQYVTRPLIRALLA